MSRNYKFYSAAGLHPAAQNLLTLSNVHKQIFLNLIPTTIKSFRVVPLILQYLTHTHYVSEDTSGTLAPAPRCRTNPFVWLFLLKTNF